MLCLAVVQTTPHPRLVWGRLYIAFCLTTYNKTSSRLCQRLTCSRDSGDRELERVKKQLGFWCGFLGLFFNVSIVFYIKSFQHLLSLRDLLILNSLNLGALRTQPAKVPHTGTQGNFTNKTNSNKKLAEELSDLCWLLSLSSFRLLQNIYIKSYERH